MRKRITQLFLILALLAGCALAHAVEALPEYQIKAAFLYHFAEFVTWPTNSFAGKNEPYVIGILGKDPFGDNLESTLGKNLLNGHPFIVRRLSKPAEARGCHILFISRSEARHVDDILAAVKDQPILTVSEIEDFAAKGGMVQFTNIGGKVRFIINNPLARAAGLRISSQLLSLAVPNTDA